MTDLLIIRHEPTGHELTNLGPCLMKLDVADIFCRLYEELNNMFRSRHSYIPGGGGGILFTFLFARWGLREKEKKEKKYLLKSSILLARTRKR